MTKPRTNKEKLGTWAAHKLLRVVGSVEVAIRRRLAELQRSRCPKCNTLLVEQARGLYACRFCRRAEQQRTMH